MSGVGSLEGGESEQDRLSWAARRSLEEAVAAAARGERRLALRALEEGIGHDPELPAGRLVAAHVRFALGQREEALGELARAERRGAGGPASALRERFARAIGTGDVDELSAALLREAAGWLEGQRRPSEGAGESSTRGELHRDVELLGLHAGLRRAVRLTLLPRDVERTRQRYADQGLVTVLAPERVRYHGRPHALLFGAKSETDGRRALDADLTRDVGALGQLLGYPGCCIDAFVRRGRGYRMYDGARAGWVPRPMPRLNNLLFGVGARFISFEPCRYDCSRASAVADAVANALDAVDPASVRWCDDQLARAVLVEPAGAHLVVELEGGRHPVIGRAEAVPPSAAQPVDARAEELARRALGRRVGRRGSVRLSWRSRGVVVDFGWRRRQG